jgi:hypothetical protein
MIMKALGSHLSGNVLISPSFLKNSFSRYKIVNCQVIFFQHFKYYSAKKCIDEHNKSRFPSVSKLLPVSPRILVGLFGFILLGVHWTAWICMCLFLSSNLGFFPSHFLLWDVSRSLFLLFSFRCFEQI